MTPVSYLLRVTIDDRPGSLGQLAVSLGSVAADIISLEVIERGDGWAVDDIVVDLPLGALPDTLITAAAKAVVPRRLGPTVRRGAGHPPRTRTRRPRRHRARRPAADPRRRRTARPAHLVGDRGHDHRFRCGGDRVRHPRRAGNSAGVGELAAVARGHDGRPARRRGAGLARLGRAWWPPARRRRPGTAARPGRRPPISDPPRWRAWAT